MENLQEALKDLRDIHNPEAISSWPIAPGWWLTLILLVIIIFVFIRLIRKHNTPKYKKLAIQEYQNILANYQIQKNSHDTVNQLALLIRKALVAKDGNEKVAGLIGDEWLHYLDQKSGTSLFSSGVGKVLVSGQYQKEIDPEIDDLLHATKKLLSRL